MKYRHYRGNTYAFMCEVVNAETRELMVVYRDVVDGKKLWCRPASIFYGDVSPGVKRFEPIQKCVLLLEVKGKTNGMRIVWLTVPELERLKATRDVSPYLHVHEVSLLPSGDWDYILVWSRDANSGRLGG